MQQSEFKPSLLGHLLQRIPQRFRDKWPFRQLHYKYAVLPWVETQATGGILTPKMEEDMWNDIENCIDDDVKNEL